MTDPRKPYELMNKIANKVIETFTEIQTMTQQYIKEVDQEKKAKQIRQRPPIVHFEKQMGNNHNNIETNIKKNNKLSHSIADIQEKSTVHNQKIKVQEKPGTKQTQKKVKADPEDKKNPRIMSPRVERLNTVNKPKEEKNKQKEGNNKPKVEKPVKNEKQQLLKKIAIERPKQPLSAYLRFSQSVMEKIRKENPNLHQSDLIAVTGHMWNGLSESDKLPFREAERRDKQKYEAERIQYETKHPELKTRKAIRKDKNKAKK